MNKSALLCAIIAGSMVLSACASFTTPTPTAVPTNTPAGPSPTPDPCSQESLPQTVKLVNDHMRQFDDYAALASSVAQSQLPQVVPPMQTIKRTTEDQAIPGCLNALKKFALQYMDTTIQTLLAFEAGAKAQALAAGILQARKYHDQYVVELARLLGVTLAAPTATATTASGTPAANVPTPTSTAVTAVVTNPGPNPVNMHVTPSLTAQTIATLGASESAQALGKTPNGEWILVALPGQAGQTAWIYTSVIQFTGGDLNTLPVANP